ncbi:MAG: hypothetical protein IT328_14040 [Caldilineaceae bacterium]|nr:hypothetical protein [Caldilineaceae bacterium]
MLQIDKVQQIQGVTVYGDDIRTDTFYLVPQQPRYRLDDNGEPVFKFLKYRFPVDHPDGKVGGGFFIFDSEFVVPEDKIATIKQTLAAQTGFAETDIRIGTITYTSGETLLNIEEDDGTFVEKVFNAGVPSLYGNNIATFSAELTPEGATLFEQALQGKGGRVSVVYKMKFYAKLPPMKVNAWFNSTQFYSFFQTIDVEWNLWAEDDYRETVREQLIETQSMGVDIDPGGITDEALKGDVRDWAFSTLEDYIEKKMITSIAPVPDDQRKLPDGIENVTRDIQSTKVASFNLSYKESSTVEWPLNPTGTLPNITNLLDRNGQPIKWEDYASVIDLDDPFFKQLRVDTRVNADFEKLPIHSVEIMVLYNDRPMANLEEGPEGEIVLNKPDAIGHFATFVENDNWEYTYSYQINYKGQSQIFQSEPVKTKEGNLTIGVDDVGILTVDVGVADINWNEVERALIRITYEDPQENVGPLEDAFILDKDHSAHLFQEVIFKPFRKSYNYTVKYFMKDGRELETDPQEGRAHNLFISDPFIGLKTVRILAAGDLQNQIANIFVDLTYHDDKNDYNVTKSAVLNATSPSAEWVFPVLSQTLGAITYSGNVMLKDGSVRPIEPKTTTDNAIIVPKAPVGSLKVTLNTDLLDFSTYKLLRVALGYKDDANLIDEHKNFVFNPTNRNEQIWSVNLFDPMRKSYSVDLTYFMNDNTQKTVGKPTVTDDLLILEPPPA